MSPEDEPETAVRLLDGASEDEPEREYRSPRHEHQLCNRGLPALVGRCQKHGQRTHCKHDMSHPENQGLDRHMPFKAHMDPQMTTSEAAVASRRVTVSIII